MAKAYNIKDKKDKQNCDKKHKQNGKKKHADKSSDAPIIIHMRDDSD